MRFTDGLHKQKWLSMGRFRLLKDPLVNREVFMESVQVLRVYQRRYFSAERLILQRKCYLDGKQEDSFTETTRCSDKALLHGWNTVSTTPGYIWNMKVSTNKICHQCQPRDFSSWSCAVANSQFLTLCSHEKSETRNPKDLMNKSQNIISVLCYNLLLFDVSL